MGIGQVIKKDVIISELLVSQGQDINKIYGGLGGEGGTCFSSSAKRAVANPVM
jgi:hypothetical protein